MPVIDSWFEPYRIQVYSNEGLPESIKHQRNQLDLYRTLVESRTKDININTRGFILVSEVQVCRSLVGQRVVLAYAGNTPGCVRSGSSS